MSTQSKRNRQLARKATDPRFMDVALAYADCWDYDNGKRNLDFKGAYCNADTFLQQAEFTGAYNEFDMVTANALVKYFGKNAQYRLAREGSVCVYIKGYTRCPSYGSFDADEIDEENKEIRLWWD